MEDPLTRHTTVDQSQIGPTCPLSATISCRSFEVASQAKRFQICSYNGYDHILTGATPTWYETQTASRLPCVRRLCVAGRVDLGHHGSTWDPLALVVRLTERVCIKVSDLSDSIDIMYLRPWRHTVVRRFGCVALYSTLYRKVHVSRWPHTTRQNLHSGYDPSVILVGCYQARVQSLANRSTRSSAQSVAGGSEGGIPETTRATGVLKLQLGSSAS